LVQQEAALKSEFIEEYRQISPGSSDVLDPQAVVNSLRTRSTGGAYGATPVFLQSMQLLGRAMQKNRAVAVEAISYRPGVVDIRVSAPDVPTLDNVRQVIGEGGKFSATIQSTDQNGELVNSRIQIQANSR
jgi:hypothetical protein